MEHDYDTLLAEAERTLDDVDHALARLNAGTYGTCELCGEPIDEVRLEAMPTARSCGHHPQLTDPSYVASGEAGSGGMGPDGEDEPDGDRDLITAADIDPHLDAVLGFAAGEPDDLDPFADLDAGPGDGFDIDIAVEVELVELELEIELEPDVEAEPDPEPDIDPDPWRRD